MRMCVCQYSRVGLLLSPRAAMMMMCGCAAVLIHVCVYVYVLVYVCMYVCMYVCSHGHVLCMCCAGVEAGTDADQQHGALALHQLSHHWIRHFLLRRQVPPTKNARTHVLTHIHTRTHTYTHTHVHAHTYTHTHIILFRFVRRLTGNTNLDHVMAGG